MKRLAWTQAVVSTLATLLIAGPVFAHGTGHVASGSYDAHDVHSAVVQAIHFEDRTFDGFRAYSSLHVPDPNTGLPRCTIYNQYLESNQCYSWVRGPMAMDTDYCGTTVTVFTYNLPGLVCDALMTPRGWTGDPTFRGLCNFDSRRDRQKAHIVQAEYSSGQDGFPFMHYDAIEVDTSGPSFNPALTGSPCGYVFCYRQHQNIRWPGGDTPCTDMNASTARDQVLARTCGPVMGSVVLH